MGSISLSSFFKPNSDCATTTMKDIVTLAHSQTSACKLHKQLKNRKRARKDLVYPRDIIVVGIRWWHLKGGPVGPLTAKIAKVEEEEEDESGGDW